MGHTTEFDGQLKLDKQLTPDHARILASLYEDSGNKAPQIATPHRPERGYCGWRATKYLDGIEWNGAEKFYSYIEWMRCVVLDVLAPLGYVANGEITWSGEESNDQGRITVENNVVRVFRGVKDGAIVKCPSCEHAFRTGDIKFAEVPEGKARGFVARS